jgi:ABC-type multidrug transport system fused ATPase/permease subunit
VVSALRSNRLHGIAIVVGSVMHAAGHAFLAAAAGTLARALASGSSASAADLAATVGPFGGVLTPGNAALVLAMAGLFAAIVKLVGGALSSWGEARIAGTVAGAVRLQVLDDLVSAHRLRGLGHDDHGSNGHVAVGTQPDRLAALTSHVADVERGVAFGVLAEARAFIQLVPLAILLVILAPKLAGSAVVALAGFGILASGLRRAFKRAHARATIAAAGLVGAADEAVKHAELWVTYGAQRRIRSHVARIGQAIALEAARIRVRGSLLSSLSEVLGALALVLALVLAARGALGVDRGTVVPFAIAFFMAYRPLRDLVDARLARGRGEEALRAALGAIEERRSVEERATPAKTLASRRAWSPADLVLASARARYGKHAPISVTVPAGSIVAIVGPTGIGKTSLLRALLGLAALEEGELRWDGVALDGAGVGPAERPFAWVPQDAPVVSDTLAINVGLGRADDDAAIPDPAGVLRLLGNEELASTLGDSVLMTERPLSGGERQWIAVARAFATGLPVVLLDEPTSSLDPLAQARLLEAIVRLRGQRTVIVVTHRSEPLAIADLVVRLDTDRSNEDVDHRAGFHRDPIGVE